MKKLKKYSQSIFTIGAIRKFRLCVLYGQNHSITKIFQWYDIKDFWQTFCLYQVVQMVWNTRLILHNLNKVDFVKFICMIFSRAVQRQNYMLKEVCMVIAQPWLIHKNFGRNSFNCKRTQPHTEEIVPVVDYTM